MSTLRVRNDLSNIDNNTSTNYEAKGDDNASDGGETNMLTTQ